MGKHPLLLIVIISHIHKATDNAKLSRTEVKQKHAFTGHKSRWDLSGVSKQ